MTHHLLLPLLLLLQHQTSTTYVSANHHHPPKGQCPLRVPPEFSSTSPIDFRHTINDDPNHESHESSHEKPKRPPLLTIGHRGTSYNIPEHTLEGYRLALELRADYLEMDLVPTKDRVLVAMHDIDLNRTTDVARKFPDRFRNLTSVEGRKEGGDNGNNNGAAGAGGGKDSSATVESGYYVMDFTLAEIKTLRVRQSIEDTHARNRMFDWHFSVPTFTEIIDLLHEWNTNVRPLIDHWGITTKPGLYVELRRPRRIFEDSGIIMTDLLLDELRAHHHGAHMFFGVKPNHNNNTISSNTTTASNTTTTTTSVATNFGCEKPNEYHVPSLVIQCFESAVLESLRTSFLDDDGATFNHAQPPLVYLVSRRRCRDPTFWFDIAGLQISGIGVEKDCLLDTASGAMGRQFMISAEEHNLAIHPWTERLEDEFVVDTDRYGSAEDELRFLYCELGVHGIFAENVDLAVRVGMRGCDDFKDVSELIRDEIKIEEEMGDTEMTKKICPHFESDDSMSIGLACMMLGMFAGSLITFWLTSRFYIRKYAVVSLHSNSNEYL